jgi:hypothetical protein
MAGVFTVCVALRRMDGNAGRPQVRTISAEPAIDATPGPPGMPIDSEAEAI